MDGESHPVMTRTCAVAIVKVLMPTVALTMKVSDFATLKSCTKWLGELAGGTTWVDEMRAFEERNELEEARFNQRNYLVNRYNLSLVYPYQYSNQCNY